MAEGPLPPDISSRWPPLVDETRVKGLDKLTNVRLAEVITQKGVISPEVITDALYAQDKYGDSFVQTLVSGGHITEWDLAKLVAENFQLPFLMASNYDITEEATKRLPRKVLFESLLVPLDVFDDVVCVVMPIMTPFETLAKIQREAGCDLFPYVGLLSENTKVLGDLYGDFKEWFEQDRVKREQQVTTRNTARPGTSDWMSIFDAGDEAIQQGLGEPQPKADGQKKAPKNFLL